MGTKEIQTKTEQTLSDLFELLGLETTFEFEHDPVNDKRIKVKIGTDNPNLLIGYHGETLNAIQNILNSILYRYFEEEGVGVVVDVEGYREERERKLLEIAENASQKAKLLNMSVALYPMNSYERRLVHTKVSEIEGVTSVSEGEGHERHVVIKPE